MADTTALDDVMLRERLVHIDQMLADIDRVFAERDRKRQEIRYAPWLAAFAGMTAGAALFGSGAAVGAILVRLYFP